MKNNNIRLFREIKGYSQEYVAKRLGKSQAAYSKIENGYTQLSDEIIIDISKILEVPKERLTEEEKDLMQPVDGAVTKLLNQLSENKKLLREVELNQENLQLQLNTLLSKLIGK
ncbi:MAG: helix-turn-helix transcriptional regulator [Ginsengibacter sp.]